MSMTLRVYPGCWYFDEMSEQYKYTRGLLPTHHCQRRVHSIYNQVRREIYMFYSVELCFLWKDSLIHVCAKPVLK